MKKPVYIIAEIGNNHLGSVARAKALALAAHQAGADAVKFQAINPEKIVTREQPLLSHVPDTECKTQRERFSKVCLTQEQLREVSEYCFNNKISFFATPFDEDQVDFLDELQSFYKVASGDVDNIPLIRRILEKHKPVLVSTGTATEEELDTLVTFLPPEGVTLMHCVSLYPTPREKVNLASISFLRRRYGFEVGFSDHTAGDRAVTAAVALGATVIEKHFVDDRNRDVGDKAVSLEPDEFSEYVSKVREIEQMIGHEGKPVSVEEKAMVGALRRCAYVAKEIEEGEEITDDKVRWLRPKVAGALDFYQCYKSGQRFYAARKLMDGGAVGARDVYVG